MYLCTITCVKKNCRRQKIRNSPKNDSRNLKFIYKYILLFNVIENGHTIFKTNVQIVLRIGKLHQSPLRILIYQKK